MDYNAAITGWGWYSPTQVLSNHDLEKLVDTDDAWILSRTGIRERRIAAPGETTSTMATIAGRLALVSETHALDVAVASGGTFSSDPQAIYDQWDAFIEDLTLALQAKSVGEEEKSELFAAIAPMRDDIVEKKAPKKK